MPVKALAAQVAAGEAGEQGEHSLTQDHARQFAAAGSEGRANAISFVLRAGAPLVS